MSDLTAAVGRMHGRVAVVTGAAGGLGRAITTRLLADGANVVVVDRDPAGMRALVEELGDVVEPVLADLAIAADRDRVVPAALQRFGRVDIMINNAADGGDLLPFLDTLPAEWERVLATNLIAAMTLCQAAARDMITRRSGSIVNITAIQERLPLPRHVAYGASKGGLSALTRVLAAELSPYGIRVNAVAPGMIRSAALEANPGYDADASPTLMGRDGSPEELAAAVAFLAGDDASFVTGDILTVDGGRTISRRADPIADACEPGGEL